MRYLALTNFAMLLERIKLAHGWLADELVWIARREASRAMGANKFQFPEFPADERRFLLSLWWD